VRFLSCLGDGEPELVDIDFEQICQGSAATQVMLRRVTDGSPAIVCPALFGTVGRTADRAVLRKQLVPEGSSPKSA
jgi:hypothetical protein